MNVQNKFFDEEHMLFAVSETRSAGQSVEALNSAVYNFSDSAEQFDDFTVLALYYRGNSNRILNLKPELSSLSELRKKVLKNAGESANAKK